MKAIPITCDEQLLDRLDNDEEVKQVGRSAVICSAMNLDHIQTIEPARLSRYIGHLSSEKMRAVCRAIAVATGCD